MTALEKESLMAGLFGNGKTAESIKATGGKQTVAIEQLHPSPRNCFQVEMDEAMEELIASVREKGILSPLLVRPSQKEDGYEILSGHRRCFAAAEVGLKSLPVIIMDVSDEERDIIIADSNLQRPRIRISERAWAIRMKYDAIKRRTNGEPANGILGVPGTPKEKSAEIIAGKMGVGEKTIKRHIRLTYLIGSLLELVDQSIVPLKAGVQLSYLSEEVQEHVHAVIASENLRINEELAKSLRERLPEDADQAMVQELLGKKKRMVKKVSIKVNKEIKKKYFPKGYDDAQINQIIEELLENWKDVRGF